MQKKMHFDVRTNQRGISMEMIETTIKYGRTMPNRRDRIQLNRKGVQKVLSFATDPEEIRTLKKIFDKGGLVVVSVDNTLVSAWNCAESWSFARKRKAA